MLEATLNAIDNAYALWGFKVGSAVLGMDTLVYEGMLRVGFLGLAYALKDALLIMRFCMVIKRFGKSL